MSLSRVGAVAHKIKYGITRKAGYSGVVLYTSLRRFPRRSPVQSIRGLPGVLATMPLIPIPPILCNLCNKPVTLESAGTDQGGSPVHEDCYIAKLTKPTKGEQKQTGVKMVSSST
jgi:hypothetical protein